MSTLQNNEISKSFPKNASKCLRTFSVSCDVLVDEVNSNHSNNSSAYTYSCNVQLSYHSVKMHVH